MVMADDRERLNDVGSTKWHFTLAWLPRVCFSRWGFVLVSGLTGFGTDGTGAVCGDR
jgi:hypothetical protein